MNFFEHQEVAKRSTTRLVVLFVLAVAALVVGVNLAAAFGLSAAGSRYGPGPAALVTLSVLAVIGLGTLYRLASLRGGGPVVAAGLGGRLVQPGSASPKERQYLNVVEEIAIAAGTPVPAVFVLDGEEGINAFAAGLTPQDSAIGVTRGALDKLTRDELQGVIAHEFSHILHGDSRLNVRLMGLLYGILLVGLIGQFALRSMRFAGRSSGRQGNNGVLVVLVIGVALMVLGYAGTFFGDLIKAAVSRQREFLADASAVQYTRNPLGIAGALMKIGGLREGSQVEHRGAIEASHMFFGSGRKRNLRGLFATHPPLEDRVVRLVPGLSGRLTKAFAGDRAAMSALQHGAAGLAAEFPDLAPAPPAASALRQAGQLSDAHIERARAILGDVPRELRESAAEPFGARIVLHALLHTSGAAGPLPPAIDGDVRRVAKTLGSLPPPARHALAELALGALGQFSPQQGEALLAELDRALGAGAEFGAVALRSLAAASLGERRAAGSHRLRLPRAADALRAALSALAERGSRQPAERARAFQLGWAHSGLGALEPLGAVDGRALGQALATLAQLVPADRSRVLECAALVMEADGTVQPEEAELFRVFAESLDVPIPPLLEGQPLAGPGVASRA